jgi:hypothetical protein
MAPSKKSIAHEKDMDEILSIRRIFAWAALASLAFMILCVAVMASAGALKIGQRGYRIVFDCLFYGGLGFFLTTSARFCLDIMYGIFGLMQVKITELLAWLALSIFSLLPIAAIYAFLRLAAGFQA